MTTTAGTEVGVGRRLAAALRRSCMMSDMQADQTGSASANGDNSIAVSGIYIDTRTQCHLNDEEVIEEASSPPDRSAGKFIVVSILIVLFIIVASCLFDPVKEYKEDDGNRPKGSSNKSVLEVVRDTILNCAKAVVAAPRNCPQLENNSRDGIVDWKLYGDPVDGAQVAWRKDHFSFRGNAIMVATYKSYVGDVVDTKIVGFAGTASWGDGKAVVNTIAGITPLSVDDVKKKSVSLRLSDVASMVHNMFEECRNAKTIPMPPRCPNQVAMVRTDGVKWSLLGDPLLNARLEFDSATGILHVHGSFAAEASYELFLSGMTKQAFAGDFDALIVLANSAPIVLQIRAV